MLSKHSHDLIQKPVEAARAHEVTGFILGSQRWGNKNDVLPAFVYGFTQKKLGQAPV
jgi:hypothetical protein